MHISDIEALVEAAAHGQGENKIRASQMLDQLRGSSDRWSHGLRLFFESSSSVPRFFGLSLVRDFLASTYGDNEQSEQQRDIIRTSLLQWINADRGNLASLEVYMVNNIGNIITLCVKRDFPERWPSAFQDILDIGSRDRTGLDFAVRIIADIEVEVVMFNESRTAAEVAHNTMIKDAMRATQITKNIIDFLANSADLVLDTDAELSERCLFALADLIGWVDIDLIVSGSVLSRIYDNVRKPEIADGAVKCLIEIAKKGMDPVLKLKLLQSIQLLDVLSSLQLDMEDAEGIEEEVGEAIDVVLLELLGCYTKYEVATLAQENSEITQSGALIVSMLLRAVPLALKIFNHRMIAVSGTVVESFTRFIVLMKAQKSQRPITEAHFSAQEYLPQLLSAIYKQMHYPEHFSSFSGSASASGAAIEDDDDDEVSNEIEAKKQVRKLFVNCARVYPEACLQLISAVLSSQPPKLSTAPHAPLEAALRLVHAFSECGPQYSKMVTEGTFPAIVEAIHCSDVGNHSHPLVLLAYYELTARYAKSCSLGVLQRVVGNMVGSQGLRHSDVQLRSRTAYFLLKIVETIGSDAGSLLGVVGSFSDLILTQAGRDPPLSEHAELHLLEAVGLMTAADYTQCNLLNEMLSVLAQQLDIIAQHPQFDRYGNDLAEMAARKLGSFAALSRGHSNKSDIAVQLFASSLQQLTGVMIKLGPFKATRNKSIVFMHRMVPGIGERVLPIAAECLPVWLQYAESSDIEHPLQLLNQLMTEFGLKTSHIVSNVFDAVLDHLGAMYGELEAAGRNSNHVNDVMSAFETEKVAVQRHYLVFLQTLVSCPCRDILLSQLHVGRLPSIMSNIVTGVQGGGSGISVSSGIPLRRLSMGILIQLTSSWIASNAAVAANVQQMLISLLCDEALPLSLRQCCDGTIDLKDAQTQGFLGDVGMLLWTLASTRPQDTQQYLQSMLPSIGWSSVAVSGVLHLLFETGQVATTIRDAFKKFMRQMSA